MTLRTIVSYPDPVLAATAERVEVFDEELRQLADDMAETMRKANGVGLAGPQVGISRRVVVIEPEEGELTEMINPVISDTAGEQIGAEGCLSVKGKQGTVTRPYRVKAEYRDRTGRKHKLTAEGFFARAVCHELDHLDGIIYTDIASEVYDLPEEDKQ